MSCSKKLNINCIRELGTLEKLEKELDTLQKLLDKNLDELACIGCLKHGEFWEKVLKNTIISVRILNDSP